MRTITRVYVTQHGGRVAPEQVIAVFDDGTEGILLRRTLRRYEVVAVHEGCQKSGAVAECPEASYVSLHARQDLAVPRYKADVVLAVHRIEREGV
jgi:hypothetical protein